MNFIIVQPELPRDNFIQLLVDQFPVLAAAVEANEEFIYGQVSYLTDYANSCLKNGQLSEFKKAVDFFQQTVKKVDAIAEDALYLNFLGGLEMQGDSPIYQAVRSMLESEYLAFWAE